MPGAGAAHNITPRMLRNPGGGAGVSFWVGVEVVGFGNIQAGKPFCVFQLLNTRQSPEMIITKALIFT